MPESLSRVRPDANVTLWGPMKSAYVSLRVSNIISLSSQVDHELSLLLVRVLGANARVAHAMFDALRSQHLKTQVLVAAAKVELTTDAEKHRVLRAVLKAADMAQEDRNKIAHWVWGQCPELPDTLLLANPEFVRSQNIEQARVIENPVTLAKFLSAGVFDEDDDSDNDLDKLWEINKDTVEVYSLDVLDRVVQTLVEANNVLFYFRYFMRPMSVNKLSSAVPPPPPLLVELETSDGALRKLNSLRLFRVALARVDGFAPNVADIS